ncbi:MAG: TetR/AcrR family transcriptional regulator [Deltaproteobacteria bacterium]|nr:TetR/AcrR family transcriptional regulator [Nannocystaceae bacterium]
MGRSKTIEDDELLSVARELFRRDGHGASTHAIARDAGVSQAVLFQRFGSKDELFFRAMTPEAPDLDTLLGSYPPAAAREHLLGIADRLFAYMRGFVPTLLKVVATPGVDARRLKKWHAQLPFFPVVAALAGRLEQMQRDGLLGPGDAHARSITLLAAVHSLAMAEMLTSARDRASHGVSGLEAILGVLWDGMAPRTMPRRRGAAPRARGSQRG